MYYDRSNSVWRDLGAARDEGNAWTGRLIDQAHGLESCQEREQKAEGTYITAASMCQTTPAIRESVEINVEIKVQTANACCNNVCQHVRLLVEVSAALRPTTKIVRTLVRPRVFRTHSNHWANHDGQRATSLSNYRLQLCRTCSSDTYVLCGTQTNDELVR